MVDAREFSALVSTVYDAVLKPELWQDVLARLCRELDAKAASIHVVNPLEGRASLFVEHGTDPAWTALLMSRYAAMSPIGAAVLMADLDQPVGAFDFVDEQEFVESLFYREWCEPQGYHDMLGAIISKKPNKVGAVSATRGVEKGRFGVHDREIVGLVAPHVRRAVTLSGLIEQQAKDRNAIAGVIDRLSSAVVIVDRGGTVLRSNPAGDAMCADGRVLARSNGHLALADEAAMAVFKAGLAAGGDEPQFIAAGGRDGSPHLVVLMPLDAVAGTIAVFVNKQYADMPAVGKALAALFGLTPREVAILMPLLEGRTVEEIAEQLGIAVATTRTHLNNLFAKTGTNRQADLVRKVAAAMPPVRI